MKEKLFSLQKLLFILFFLSSFLTSCLKNSSEEYRIGRDPTWSLSAFTEETENINAFTNALIEEISKQEKVFLKLVDMNPSALIPGLDLEKYEGILSALSPNMENLDKYDFSTPFLLLGPVLVVPADSTAETLEDLKGKIVGISPFNNSVLIVQKDPSIIIRYFENMPSALDELAAGTIDGVLLPILEAHALIPVRYAGTLRIAGSPLSDTALRLITLKGKNSTLLSLFNRGLAELKKTGAYLSIKAKFIF